MIRLIVGIQPHLVAVSVPNAADDRNVLVPFTARKVLVFDQGTAGERCSQQPYTGGQSQPGVRVDDESLGDPVGAGSVYGDDAALVQRLLQGTGVIMYSIGV